MINKLILWPTVFLLALIACNNSKQKETAKQKVDLYLPDDLEATLWAESPMFYNPTNMDVDYRGRIWVTEAVNYRNYNNDSTKFLHHSKGRSRDDTWRTPMMTAKLIHQKFLLKTKT